MTDLSSLKTIIANAAAPFSIIVYCIYILNTNELERLLMSRLKKTHLTLLNVAILSALYLIEIIYLETSNGDTSFLNASKPNDRAFWIACGAVAIGITAYLFIQTVLSIIKRTQYHVFLDESSNRRYSEWIIVKVTDSKKVILSHKNVLTNETVYCREDLEKIKSLQIYCVKEEHCAGMKFLLNHLSKLRGKI